MKPDREGRMNTMSYGDQLNFQNQSACLKIHLTEITKKLYIDTFLKTISNASQLLSHLLKQNVTLCGGPEKWEKRG